MRTITTIRLLPTFLAPLGLAVVIGFAVFAVVVGLTEGRDNHGTV